MARSTEDRSTFQDGTPGVQSGNQRSVSFALQAAVTGIQFPPALAGTLLRLEMMLNQRVPNLAQISNLVRSDLGFALRLLSVIGQSWEEDQSSLSVNQTIIELGRTGLRDLFSNVPTLSSSTCVRFDFDQCRRFWHHARLTGLVAQEIGASQADMSIDQAYFAGMLYRLGELPALLGWDIPCFEGLNRDEIACALASLWGFPSITNIWGGVGRRQSFASSSARELAETADHWADCVEEILGREGCSFSWAVGSRLH